MGAEVVAHADWGTNEPKRRVAVARRVGDDYVACAPEAVGDPGALLDRLGGTSALVGFDFPIGLPRAYARAVNVARFRELLPQLGSGEWSLFYEPAERLEEISLWRPFYPRRGNGTRQEHLVRALGVASIRELLRRCDRPHPERRAASSLFWTLGPAQVGRAAISGWRDVLAPALARESVTLWPFDGPLDELLARGGIVVVETYPSELYGHLGARVRSKTRADSRAAAAPALRARAAALGVDLTAEARLGLEVGFSNDDDFDAFAGLLGMLNVLLGGRPSGEPRDDEDVLAVEGWMLGQAAR